MILDEELEYCPFCGSSEVEIDGRNDGYGILCRSCGVWVTSGWWYLNKSEDAVELWNRRVKE